MTETSASATKISPSVSCGTAIEEEPAGNETQRDEGNGDGEPAESPHAVAAQQYDEQDKMRGEGECPDDLDWGEVKVQLWNPDWPGLQSRRRLKG